MNYHRRFSSLSFPLFNNWLLLSCCAPPLCHYNDIVSMPSRRRWCRRHAPPPPPRARSSARARVRRFTMRVTPRQRARAPHMRATMRQRAKDAAAPPPRRADAHLRWMDDGYWWYRAAFASAAPRRAMPPLRCHAITPRAALRLASCRRHWIDRGLIIDFWLDWLPLLIMSHFSNHETGQDYHWL